MQSVKGTTIERELKEKGRLTYTNVGVSMWPFIRQGKDLIVIEAPKGRLKQYDVPLYKINPSGNRYTLHRILKVRDRDYVIRGDNCLKKEYVRDEQIVGVLTKIIRDADMRSQKTDAGNSTGTGNSAGNSTGTGNSAGNGTGEGRGASRKQGKVITSDNPRYKFCVRLWRLIYPLRAIYYIARRCLGKLRRTLVKNKY